MANVVPPFCVGKQNRNLRSRKTCILKRGVEAALKILGGIPPDAVLVVGDSPYDVQAAAKAGLRTVGLLCGGFAESELREEGAIAIYRDPADLLEQYERSAIATGYPKR